MPLEATSVTTVASSGQTEPSSPTSITASGDAPRGERPKGNWVPPSEDTADGHFRRGQALYELNADDSAGATKEILEEAVRDLQRAIDLHHPGTATAFYLIANAYGSIAVVHAAPSERERYHELARSAYRNAIEANPAYVRARWELAGLLRDGERILQLREVLRLSPDHALALFSLGGDLFEAGQVEEGARLLLKAVQRFDADDLESFGPMIVELLRGGHMEEQARRAEESIRVRKREVGEPP